MILLHQTSVNCAQRVAPRLINQEYDNSDESSQCITQCLQLCTTKLPGRSWDNSIIISIDSRTHQSRYYKLLKRSKRLTIFTIDDSKMLQLLLLFHQHNFTISHYHLKRSEKPTQRLHLMFFSTTYDPDISQTIRSKSACDVIA